MNDSSSGASLANKSDAAASSERRPRLRDGWASHPILLDGPVERAVATGRGGSLRALAFGLLGLVGAFVLFQLIISPLVLVALLVAGGADLSLFTAPDAMSRLLEEHVRELILSNSVGQVLGLAVPALLLARLHARRVMAYVRWRPTSGWLLAGAVAGLLALTPLVQWLGTINQQIPLPEWLRALEQSQMQMIEKVLSSGMGVTFNLLMLAVVPGICEELLFRGYLQRQFERGMGVVGGVVASGFLFGLYHLRLSQALPLITLGLYLAYLTWRTGSLWPAMLVHFANNALSVAVANYAAQHPQLDAQALETMQVPWYILIPSTALFAVVVGAFHRQAQALLQERTAASSLPSSGAP